MEEKEDIGPILKNLKAHNRNAFSIPGDYFDVFSEKLMNKISQEDEPAAFPLLAGIQRKMPFVVPPYYFEEIRRYHPRPVAVIPFRKGLSIAASFIIIATAGMLLTTRRPLKENAYQPSAVSINELTNEQMERFVGSAVPAENGHTDQTGGIMVNATSLLNDVPSEDLSNFLDETAETTEQMQSN